MQRTIFLFVVLVFVADINFVEFTPNNKSIIAYTKVLDNLYSICNCVQMIIDLPTDSNYNLVDTIFEVSYHQYIVRTLDDLMSQNIHQHDAAILTTKYIALGECNVMVMFSEWGEIFVGLSVPNYTRFRPHTNLVIVADVAPEWTSQLRDIIKQKALHVCWLIGDLLYRMGVDTIEFTQLEYVLDFLKVDPATERFASEQKDDIVVSMFTCEPFTIVELDEHNNTRFDGIEYRFLGLVQQYFTVHHLIGEHALNMLWTSYALDKVQSQQADMAMCIPWLTLEHSQTFDMTEVVGLQCGTFLVPKPEPINSAVYVYYPFSATVWALTVASFLLIAVLITGLARWLRPIAPDLPSIYADRVRTVLDMLCVITGHGLDSLEREHLFTVRLLLVIWIYGTFWLGISYATGYTSLLSSPVYTDLVDTVDEYNDKDFIWSNVGHPTDFADLVNSVDRYRRLYEKLQWIDSEEEQTDLIASNDRRITIYVDLLFDRFVSGASQLLSRKIRTMRLMKSCWYSHYTTFALQKHSPYLRTLNTLIER